MGFGGWGPPPNPQTPNPQSPIPNPHVIINLLLLFSDKNNIYSFKYINKKFYLLIKWEIAK
jgi:hypothetical protein